LEECTRLFPECPVALIFGHFPNIPAPVLAHMLDVFGSQLRLLSMPLAHISGTPANREVVEAIGQLQQLIQRFSCSGGYYCASHNNPVVLAGALSKLASLRTIEIDFSVKGARSDSITGPVAEEMINCAAQTPALEELVLEKVTLDCNLEEFFALTQGSTTLKKLEVYTTFWSLPASRLSDVIRLIENNSTMEELSISFFDSHGSLASLVKILETNTSLRSLTLLSRRAPTEDEFDAFVSLLETRNYSLGLLNPTWWLMPKDSLSRQKFRRITFFLTLNRKFNRSRLLGRTKKPTQKDWIDVIQSAKEQLPVLFYFLSVNPSILKPFAM
jgi:hypothetical protein